MLIVDDINNTAGVLARLAGFVRIEPAEDETPVAAASASSERLALPRLAGRESLLDLSWLEEAGALYLFREGVLK